MAGAENDSIRTKLGGDADRLGEYYCADCANLHVVQKKWPLFKNSRPMRPGNLACRCAAKHKKFKLNYLNLAQFLLLNPVSRRNQFTQTKFTRPTTQISKSNQTTATTTLFYDGEQRRASAISRESCSGGGGGKVILLHHQTWSFKFKLLYFAFNGCVGHSRPSVDRFS